MKSKVYSLFTIAACLMGSGSAWAGFVATTGFDTVNSSNPPPTVGETFSVPDGTFTAYVPDGPSDPQIQSDLSSYGYTLNGTIQSIAGEMITYTGTYEITYTFNPGSGVVVVPVSTGNAAFTALFTPGTNDAAVTGTLTQTEGPQGPYASHFTDLGADYGNNPVAIDAAYVGGTTPDTYDLGTIQGTLTQTATAVPEPASISCGLSLIAAAGLRRNRARRHVA